MLLLFNANISPSPGKSYRASVVFVMVASYEFLVTSDIPTKTRNYRVIFFC